MGHLDSNSGEYTIHTSSIVKVTTLVFIYRKIVDILFISSISLSSVSVSASCLLYQHGVKMFIKLVIQIEKVAPFLLRLFLLNSSLYAREKLMTNRVTRRIVVLESK